MKKISTLAMSLLLAAGACCGLAYATASNPVYNDVVATATFDFQTNQYGYTVESGNSGNYLPADAEFLEDEGRVHITIDKGDGAGVRFWTGPELRVMKKSAITVSVPKGDIFVVTFYGKSVSSLKCSNSDFSGMNPSMIGGQGDYMYTSTSWSAVENVTFTNNGSSTVSITKMTVQYEGGVVYIPVTRAEAGLAIEGGETQYTAVLGEEFTAPVITKETTADLTFTSSNTKVAEIEADGSQITLVGAGTTTITASAAENDDFKPGSISYTLTVLPEGTIYSTILGEDFTFEPDADIWKHDAQYGLKATGYIADLKMNIEAEAIAVSPEITIPAGNEATLYFDQAINYLKANPIADNCNVVVRVTGEVADDDDPYYYDTDAEWVAIADAVTAPASDSWNFYANAPVDLTAFAGKIIQVGFKYNSTNEVACTWEVKNIVVTAIDPLKDIKAAAADQIKAYLSHLEGDHSWEEQNSIQMVMEAETADEVQETLDYIIEGIAQQYAGNLEQYFTFDVNGKFGACVENNWKVIDDFNVNAVFMAERVNEHSWSPFTAATAAAADETMRESNSEDAIIIYNALTGLYLGQPVAAGEPIPAVADKTQAGYFVATCTNGEIALADDANAALFLFWDETKGLIASETPATFPATALPVWDNYEDYYVIASVPGCTLGDYGATIAEKITEFDIFVSADATLTGLGNIEFYTYNRVTYDKETILSVSAKELAEMTPEKTTAIYKKTTGWTNDGPITEDVPFEALAYHFTLPKEITAPGEYIVEAAEGTWMLQTADGQKLFSPYGHESVMIEGEIEVETFVPTVTPAQGEVTELETIVITDGESPILNVYWSGAFDAVMTLTGGEQAIKTWTKDEAQACLLPKADDMHDPDIFEFKLDEKITAAGTYVLTIPAEFFENAFGNLSEETVITWTIAEGEDSISEITVNGAAAAAFDLQGRRVNNPANGIFIINGKKVLIRK